MPQIRPIWILEMTVSWLCDAKDQFEFAWVWVSCVVSASVHVYGTEKMMFVSTGHVPNRSEFQQNVMVRAELRELLSSIEAMWN